MIYADDPRCERFSAITSEFVRPGNQLFAEWVGDDIHVRCVPADQANAVALSQALEGDRFLIATILEGVRERKAEIATRIARKRREDRERVMAQARRARASEMDGRNRLVTDNTRQARSEAETIKRHLDAIHVEAGYAGEMRTMSEREGDECYVACQTATEKVNALIRECGDLVDQLAADATAPSVQVPVELLTKWRILVNRTIDLTHNPQLQGELKGMLGDIKHQLAMHQGTQS